MRTIELELDKLVGYSVAGSDEQRVKKLGSAKLGVKRIAREELDAQFRRVNSAA